MMKAISAIRDGNTGEIQKEDYTVETAVLSAYPNNLQSL